MSSRYDPPWKQPTNEFDSSGGWWWLVAVAVLTALVFFARTSSLHWYRVLAITMPTLVAALAAMLGANLCRFLVRLSWVGVGILIGVLAYFFMPTTDGVSYWSAHRRLAELQDAPREMDADFRDRWQRCAVAASSFPELEGPMEMIFRTRAGSAMQEAARAVRLAERGQIEEAKKLLTTLERGFQGMGNRGMSMVNELRPSRRIVTRCWLQQGPLTALVDLPGEDVAGFRRIMQEYRSATADDDHHHDVERLFRKAIEEWTLRSIRITREETFRLAREDRYGEAEAILKKKAVEVEALSLPPLPEGIDANLRVTFHQVVDIVWEVRSTKLAGAPPGDVAEFQKRQQTCRELANVHSHLVPLLEKVKYEWIGKSARAAASKVETLIKAGKLDEAEGVIKTTTSELMRLDANLSVEAQGTFQTSRRWVFKGRLDSARAELKKLADSKMLAEVEKLARQSAKALASEAGAIGTEAELTGFVGECVSVIVAADCRAVADLVEKGKLEEAVKRLDQLKSERKELLKLAAGGKVVGDYVSTRSKLAKAHLDAAKQELEKLLTAKKHSAVALRAKELHDTWAEELKNAGLYDELWKTLVKLADKCALSAIESADAALEKKDAETAFSHLQKVGREWEELVLRQQRRSPAAARAEAEGVGALPLPETLKPAWQRVAQAMLTDARTSFAKLMKAEDYPAVAKLKATLDTRKEFRDWQVGEGVQAFVERCEFLLDVARSAGKLK